MTQKNQCSGIVNRLCVFMDRDVNPAKYELDQ
jgi:hypothetical protein